MHAVKTSLPLSPDVRRSSRDRRLQDLLESDGGDGLRVVDTRSPCLSMGTDEDEVGWDYGSRSLDDRLDEPVWETTQSSGGVRRIFSST